MSRKIKSLLPTDFSACAENALKYTSQLLNSFELHSVLTHFSSEKVASMEDYFKKNGLNSVRLLKEAKILEEQTSNVVTDVNLEIAPLNRLNSDYLQAMDIDLLIFGTEHFDRHELSNADHMMRTINQNMIIVPSLAEYKAPKNILILSDCSRADMDLSILLNIAKNNNSIVHLATIKEWECQLSEQKMENNQKITQKLYSVKNESHIVSEENVLLGMEKLINRVQPELLVFIHKHLTDTEQHYHVGTKKQIMNKFKLPVLILK